MLTMGQSAKLVGKSKATLSRAVNSGKLNATRNASGGWDIYPLDLIETFPLSFNKPPKRKNKRKRIDKLENRISILETVLAGIIG